MDTVACAYLEHLVAAFLGVWGLLGGYLVLLWRRESRLRRELDALQRQVAAIAADSGPPPPPRSAAG